ncbi:DUF2252 domain-containing protein [Demequina mangrovi]|uniref:Uncharacterized conserved protein, DUF2252 family n=1 Tax=Demequina mangrovi TaxID=1043493 RepID=A0A1H6VAR7_9MICO|nr:DUF2252 domain-containing protein [Demequina mangrovi]SEI98877.1 Uncharacterized conserved protein, DUF2252 family [Demequina mangrovi]
MGAHAAASATEVRLEAHAAVPDPADRADPVATLVAQDASRVPALVPIRHGRMAVSPFAFYRGAAAVMAADLGVPPRTGLTVQLAGDAHLANFGFFKAPDRELVFDLNDFDETARGPFEWDLKRLAASVTVAGRVSGLGRKDIAKATRAATRGYRETMGAAAALSPLELRYRRLGAAALVARQRGAKRERSEAFVSKAARRDSVRALTRLTAVEDGRRRIVPRPPVVCRLDEALDGVNRARTSDFFSRYRDSLPPHDAAVLRDYRFVDLARKVVGVGSVGTRCLLVLLESRQGAPLFLQFKEATVSVLERYAGDAGFENAGERVVRGQRLMQTEGDILLGWSRYERPDGGEVDFYVRQLWDGKASLEIDEMGPGRLARYAWHCGAVLALAHARSGDAAAIAAYLGEDDAADRVLAEFARGYADLNEADHAAHQAAIADGRIVAVTGV